MPARQPFLVLAAAAIVLLLPSLVLGTLISHSSPQNLTWAAQFAEQVRAGVLYPRWMPDSFEGLGSPAFYFYPPLPFWADALVSIVTANVMPVPYRLAGTSTLVLLASGLASTLVGVQTGDVVMQGFGRRPISPLLRRLFAVVPALVILGLGVEPTDALVWSQVVLSFALPGTLVPLLLFTRDRRLMGVLANHREIGRAHV